MLDNKDILAANGLYYASWVNGEPQPYENSEGKTVDLYDAQLTLVVQENKTEERQLPLFPAGRSWHSRTTIFLTHRP